MSLTGTCSETGGFNWKPCAKGTGVMQSGSIGSLGLCSTSQAAVPLSELWVF